MERVPRPLRFADRLGDLGFALARASIARPGRALAVAAVALLLLAPGLARLELRTDGAALVPSGDPAVAADREIRDRFGLLDPVVVLVESSHPDGIYNPETLRRIHDLSRRLAALDGVAPERVLSLATERSYRYHREPPAYRAFLDPLPRTPSELARVRGDVEAVGLLEGTLVSADGRAAAVLVGVPPASSGAEAHDRRELTRRIETVVAESAGPPDRLSVVGAPVAAALLGDHVLRDLVLLVPIALVVMGVVLWIGCRRLAGVLLGAAEVAICLGCTFGLMGWTGVPLYLTTAVLPVILTCVGLADEVHLFWRHQRLLGEMSGRSGAQVAEQTARELARPIVFTSLTTAVGFLSFAISPLPAVRAFGLFAAFGVGVCLLFSLSLVPAILARLPAEALRRPDGAFPARRALAAALARRLERPGRTLAVLAALTLVLGAGALRIEVQDSWIGGFSSDSPFRRATARADELLAGTHTLLVEITAAGGEEPLLEPDAVRAIGAFERFLSDRPEVGGVLGLHAHVTTTRVLASGGREDRREVPERAAWVRQMIAQMELVRGEARRREMVDDGFRRTVVTVLLEAANYRDTERLLDAIRSYEAERLAPLGLSLRFGGDVAVSQAMIPAIVRSQLLSLGLALAGTLLTASLLYGSAAIGAVVVAPTVAAVLWISGVMGWLGVPIGVATSMFCAVTLGIGIDYGIHLFDRYRIAREEGEGEPALAAVLHAGPAIVADTAAIALGFGTLAFSSVPASRSLGLLVAGALGASCLLTLAGQGAWLARGDGRLPDPETDAHVPQEDLHAHEE